MDNSSGLVVPLGEIDSVIAFDVEFVRGPKIFVTKKPKYINLPIRVAVVDMPEGNKRTCYHTYVRPYAAITHYNSPLTGLGPDDETANLLSASPDFDEVKSTLQHIFRRRKIIVMDGQQDFTVFGLEMRRFQVVDISNFIVDEDGRSVSIRRLMAGLHDIDLSTEDFHDPSDDAYWTLKLFNELLSIQGTPKNGKYEKVIVDVPKGGRINWNDWYSQKKGGYPRSKQNCDNQLGNFFPTSIEKASILSGAKSS